MNIGLYFGNAARGIGCWGLQSRETDNWSGQRHTQDCGLAAFQCLPLFSCPCHGMPCCGMCCHGSLRECFGVFRWFVEAIPDGKDKGSVTDLYRFLSRKIPVMSLQIGCGALPFIEREWSAEAWWKIYLYEPFAECCGVEAAQKHWRLFGVRSPNLKQPTTLMWCESRATHIWSLMETYSCPIGCSCWIMRWVLTHGQGPSQCSCEKLQEYLTQGMKSGRGWSWPLEKCHGLLVSDAGCSSPLMNPHDRFYTAATASIFEGQNCGVNILVMLTGPFSSLNSDISFVYVMGLRICWCRCRCRRCCPQESWMVTFLEISWESPSLLFLSLFVEVCWKRFCGVVWCMVCFRCRLWCVVPGGVWCVVLLDGVWCRMWCDVVWFCGVRCCVVLPGAVTLCGFVCCVGCCLLCGSGSVMWSRVAWRSIMVWHKVMRCVRGVVRCNEVQTFGMCGAWCVGVWCHGTGEFLFNAWEWYSMI